jgi:hypothetical protein
MVTRVLRRGRRAGLADGRRGRRCVVWFLLAFAVSQVAHTVALESAVPRWRDPEFEQKRTLLRARRAEHPAAPVVVALGSSRVYMGIRPGLAVPDDRPDAPLLFNGGTVAAGPLMQLLTLDRLLRAGERPDAVVIEFWLFAFLDHADVEENRIDPNRLSRDDLPVVTRYAADPGPIRTAWRTARAVPSYSHRAITRSLLVPTWHPFNRRLDSNWARADGWGWRAGQDPGGDANLRRWLVNWHHYTIDPAVATERLRPLAVRATCGLLDFCRRHEIRTAIIFLPESSEFRSWYSPAAEAAGAALLREWEALGIPVVQARLWARDEELSDSCHLTPAGASVFTAWFARDVLPHWRDWPVPAVPAE